MPQLMIFTRRFNHDETIDVSISPNGWRVQHVGMGGECDPSGEPHLYTILEHDGVNYPKALPDYLSYLWEAVNSNRINPSDVQSHLDGLGAWIQTVEHTTPGGIFTEVR